MGRRRKGIPATAAGTLILRRRIQSGSVYELNELIKREVERWKKSPAHPERANYDLKVVGGSEIDLAIFTLVHKDETYKSAILDVWDLEVQVEPEDTGYTVVTIRL